MSRLFAGFRRIAEGTHSGSWIFWAVVTGLILYFALPDLVDWKIGLLTGLFTAIKLEHNALRQRVKYLERITPNPTNLGPRDSELDISSQPAKHTVVGR